MPAVALDHIAGQQPLHAQGEGPRPRGHREVQVGREEGPRVHDQVPPSHNAANRVTTSARSVSAGTSFVRSLPRPMTWCRIPGASKRGGLGMRRHCRLPLQESSCFRTYVPHYECNQVRSTAIRSGSKSLRRLSLMSGERLAGAKVSVRTCRTAA